MTGCSDFCPADHHSDLVARILARTLFHDPRASPRAIRQVTDPDPRACLHFVLAVRIKEPLYGEKAMLPGSP